MNTENGSSCRSSSSNKPLLIGCGIFKKEIKWIDEQNNWNLETDFLPSALHVNFNKLSSTLTHTLEEHKDDEKIVFYGACHPQMEKILEDANTFRTCGVNCVEMLIGHDMYMKELENGAFFLLEDWALNWEKVIIETFGNNQEVIRQIFQGDRKYILAIKTPVSCDFSSEAEAVAEYLGMPLKFMDVSLNRLEKVIEGAVDRWNKQKICQH